MASIRCVRPVLTTSLPRSAPSCSMASARCSSAGSSSRSTARAALTWIAVGITSLLLCPMLTWSFGCTGVAGDAARQRGDHLVGVHVGAGARAGLEDVHRKLGVVMTRRRRPRQLPGWPQQRPRSSRPSSSFAPAAAHLTSPRRAMNARRHGAPADREILHRPLGLRAPQCLGRHPAARPCCLARPDNPARSCASSQLRCRKKNLFQLIERDRFNRALSMARTGMFRTRRGLRYDGAILTPSA